MAKPTGRTQRANIPVDHQEGVLLELKHDHQRVKARMEDLLAMPISLRAPVFAEIKMELRKHAEAEDAHVYPVFLANGVQSADLDTAATQHEALEDALATIETAGATEAEAADYTALNTALNTHITFEEGTLFPQAYSKLTVNQLQISRTNFLEAKRVSEAV
jgi:hemerythrin-like domain-containing protein